MALAHPRDLRGPEPWAMLRAPTPGLCGIDSEQDRQTPPPSSRVCGALWGERERGRLKVLNSQCYVENLPT